MKGWWVRYKFCILASMAYGLDGRGPRTAVVSWGVSASFRRSYLSDLPAETPDRTLVRASASVESVEIGTELWVIASRTRQESSAHAN